MNGNDETTVQEVRMTIVYNEDTSVTVSLGPLLSLALISLVETETLRQRPMGGHRPTNKYLLLEKLGTLLGWQPGDELPEVEGGEIILD